jgi:hypothetical protein
MARDCRLATAVRQDAPPRVAEFGRSGRFVTRSLSNMASTCPWDGFTRAEYAGCEPDLCAWIIHPAETWSNLAFIAIAAWLVVRYGRADRRLPVSWFPLIVVAIGVFSAAFHASMLYWLLAADLAVIFLFTGFLLAANLQHGGLVGARWFPASFLVLAVGGAAVAFVDPRLGYIGIAAQGVAILWSAGRIPARGPRRDLGAAVVLNQAAAVAFWLDRGQVWCARGVLAHVVQPHSFWHVLSALCLLFFYRYERRIEHIVHDRPFGGI